jgi:hypothetical protein
MIPETIAAIKGDLAGHATAHIISLLGDSRLKLLTIEDIKNFKESQTLDYPVVMDEDQIEFLSCLRLNGWYGGVLVLSVKSRAELIRKYPILRQGFDAHNSSTINLNLNDILAKIESLKPIGKYNLKEIQYELKENSEERVKEIKEKIDIIKRDITKDISFKLDELYKTIDNLCLKTPAACHYRIIDDALLANLLKEIPDFPDSPQISTCFNILMEKVKTNYSDRKIDLIGEVAEYWSKRCIGTNESLNINQP